MNWKELFLDPLPDAHVKSVISLFYTNYHYDKLLANTLKPFGISYEQFNILKVLQDHHPKAYTLKEVQMRLINQTANTTRLVEKLRLKGLLLTERDSHNRRLMNISITDKGLKLLVEIEKPLEGIRTSLRNDLSVEEAKTLTALLEKVQKVCVKDN
ncbi:MAG TPA: MarR family transcriptional regulator [Cytophagales bacterium]|nr:MarR family transcriptional regulator [Cytophagales bacterium]HAA17729.1 MarR family transcriptional regulator [Cytophagales bacterium]HAP58036.1 MarR family transcriptional regulator [Cytophagales bacterium]